MYDVPQSHNLIEMLYFKLSLQVYKASPLSLLCFSQTDIVMSKLRGQAQAMPISALPHFLETAWPARKLSIKQGRHTVVTKYPSETHKQFATRYPQIRPQAVMCPCHGRCLTTL